MKRFFLHNWQIKLVSLVLAFAVWYLIRKNISDGIYRTPQSSHSESAG